MELLGKWGFIKVLFWKLLVMLSYQWVFLFSQIFICPRLELVIVSNPASSAVTCHVELPMSVLVLPDLYLPQTRVSNSFKPCLITCIINIWFPFQLKVQYDCEDVEIFYLDTDGDYVSTVFHPKFFVIIYCLCPLIRSLFQFQITCTLYYLKGTAMVMILGSWMYN